jgi:hypothetical protein
MMLPRATRIIVTPSSLKTNFSLSKIGDIMAEKTMVIQEVEAIKIMFPRPKANAFKI